jgi:NTE family protein
MTRFDLVIVGGGLTAARALGEYRAAGGGGRVALLTNENVLPYHRPPLSKRFLRGEADPEDVAVEPPAFYERNDAEVFLGAEVIAVDPHQRTVVTREGTRVGYGKLLLATGTQRRTLPVDGADLPGVFGLRSLADAIAIREAAARVRDAVVVGGGFIGIEVAASLTQLGLDVTLVSRDVDLFAQLRSPEISDHLVHLYRHRGVDVITGDEVRAFRGRSRVDTVELRTHGALGAELAVVGVGVRPALSYLGGSGIAVNDGIIVDGRFRTNLRDVYAAGDVARFPDPLSGRRRRIEHWANADYQGRQVGKILAGGGGPYDTVATFFSEAFGLTLKLVGDLARHDERVVRGSFADADAIVFYLERGRLVATLHTGQAETTERTLKALVRSRARLRARRLAADGTVALAEAFAPADGVAEPTAAPAAA